MTSELNAWRLDSPGSAAKCKDASIVAPESDLARVLRRKPARHAGPLS
jgi:hypothetical protein